MPAAPPMKCLAFCCVFGNVRSHVCCFFAGELSPALAWLLVMGLAAAGLAITSAPLTPLREHGHQLLLLQRSMVADDASDLVLIDGLAPVLPCRHELRFAHYSAVRPGPVPGDHLQRAAAPPETVCGCSRRRLAAHTVRCHVSSPCGQTTCSLAQTCMTFTHPTQQWLTAAQQCSSDRGTSLFV